MALKFFNDNKNERGLPRRASTGTALFTPPVPTEGTAAIRQQPLGAPPKVHSFSNTEGRAVSGATRSSRPHGEVPPL